MSDNDLRIELDRVDVRISEVVDEIKAARDIASISVGHPNRRDNGDLRVHLDIAERRIAQAMEAVTAAKDEIYNERSDDVRPASKKKKARPLRLSDAENDKKKV